MVSSLGVKDPIFRQLEQIVFEEMSDEYPFTWSPLSEEDDATVKRCYGELGKCRELVRLFETS